MSAEDAAGPDPYDRRTTVIARTVTRLVVPVTILTAVALLLQGHNLPGGGFIAAVLTVTGVVLTYVVFGRAFVGGVVGVSDPASLVEGYRRLAVVGLAVALASALVPLALGRSLLTQAVVFVDDLPVYGTVEVATALAFDLGVYLAVVGALLAVVGEVGAE